MSRAKRQTASAGGRASFGGRGLAEVEAARIVRDHQIMGGVPCVRGTRIPVATVLAMVAVGMTPPEIVADYPQLAAEDITAVLWFAVAAVEDRELPVTVVA
ncbi:MAG: DUF433 domain-containing protein [Dermatophilaceae bacterium]